MTNEQKADALNELTDKLQRDIELITGNKKWTTIIQASLDGEMDCVVSDCGDDTNPSEFSFAVCDGIARMFCGNQYGHDIYLPKKE